MFDVLSALGKKLHQFRVCCGSFLAAHDQAANAIRTLLSLRSPFFMRLLGVGMLLHRQQLKL